MKLIIEDYIAVGLVLLTGIIKMLTNTVMWMSANLCGITQEMAVMEANPISRILLDMVKLDFIVTYMLLPALVIGFYVYLRNKYKDTDRPLFRFLLMFLFFCFLLNFFNDFGAVLGLLMRGGG